ncbi:MAG: Gfo/Idh/MocA family oxidoreductase [Clostridiales bacterium]|nr:Gfo/Idh/MocA family oxidoreductase [Clostridiales bacterium]
MLKIGTVGTGAITEQMLRAMAQVEGVECAAVCSRSQERATQFAQNHQIPLAFISLEEMAQSSDINTVYLATPNSLHAAQALQAIAAGKHVICEKPLATTAAQAKEVFQAARARGVFVFEAVSTLYMPNFLRCAELMQEVGQVKNVVCSYTQRSSRYSAYLRGEHINAFDPEMEGGALNDLGVYAVHAVVWMLGRPHGVTYFPIRGKNGVDVSGMLTLDYPDLKVEIFCAKNCARGSSFLLQGTAATLRVDGPLNTFGQCSLDTAGRSQPFQLQDNDRRLCYELAAFREAIDGGDKDLFEQMAVQSIEVSTVLELAHKNCR